MGLFSIRPKPEELQEQVANYDTLGITKSVRGVASLFIFGSAALTAIAAIFGLIPFDGIYGLIIYLPLGYFVYKGKTWAMVAMLILWTVEKGIQLTAIFAGGNGAGVSILFWWWALAIPLFHAILVERARRKASVAAVPVV